VQYKSSPEQGWEVVREAPSRRLRPGVHGYQGVLLSTGVPHRRLEVPSGTVTLVLGFEHHLRITDLTAPPDAVVKSRPDARPDTRRGARLDAGPPGRALMDRTSPGRALLDRTPPGRAGGSLTPQSHTSLLSPLRTRSAIGEHDGSLYGMEIVLAPWAAFRLFGVAMYELAERIVDPSDLVGNRVDRLTETLAWLPDWERRFRLLDATLERWWEEGPLTSPQVMWAWYELRRTGGRVPIGELATRTDYGLRQLETRFRQQIGLPLKAVARIMRLQRTLRMLRRGHDASYTALACGFSDQAHMSREVRRMTGFPPSRLMPAYMPDPSHPLTEHRVRGRVTTFQVPGGGSGPRVSGVAPGYASGLRAPS
jgi:AraC-like DNA-binding protein